MARPQRNNVDYFPFYCDEGNKMFYLEETYGNDGFATFLKILRELAKTDFHYLDLSKPTTRMFLSAKCKVSKEILESIIKDLVDLEKFDKELWNENSIVWCQDFIDSIQDAYLKRTSKCIDRDSLLHLLVSKGVRKPSKGNKKPSLSSKPSVINPQSKEEDTKEEDNKLDNKFSFKQSLLNLGVEELILQDYLAVRKSKKATNSQTAYKSLINEIDKCPLNANEAIRVCAEQSWSGFKYAWVEKIQTKNKSNDTNKATSRLERFLGN